MLTGRDADRFDRAPNRGVAEDVVGAGGLFDPQGIEARERTHQLDRFADVPRLVRVHHHDGARSDFFAHQRRAMDVGGRVAAHFYFEAGPSRGERLAAQPPNLVVGITHPSGGRDVGRVAVLAHLRFAFAARREFRAQDVERVVASERVGEIAEVDACDELLGRHVGDEFPHRLALDFGVKIPDRIYDRRRREMNRAFLRTDPPELTFKRKPLPEAAEVGDDVVVLRADDEMLQRADRGDHNFVAAAECEGHAVAFEAVARVGAQHYVGRGIVGVGVNGVGARERSRSWGSDVAD